MSGLRAAIATTIAAVVTVVATAATIRVAPVADAVPGDLVTLTVSAPETTAQVRVKAFNCDAPVYRRDAHTWTALVGVDLDVAPGTYSATITTDDGTATQPIVVRKKVFPTRRLRVDPAFVTPPPSALPRIESDNRLLQHTWASSPPERQWSAPFVRPVPDPANSAFGTRSIFNGLPRNAHGGADFLSGAGTPIHAPNAGRVAIARDLYYSGNTVVIDHGLGLFSMLAHLSEIQVKEGDELVRAQIVGKVGATGRVTGPHLHWAVRVCGARVDPIALLRAIGDTPPPGNANEIKKK